MAIFLSSDRFSGTPNRAARAFFFSSSASAGSLNTIFAPSASAAGAAWSLSFACIEAYMPELSSAQLELYYNTTR